MTTTVTVETNSIVGVTIAAVIAELESREDIRDLGFDTIEAIATHIVMTDTDWSSDMVNDEDGNPMTRDEDGNLVAA